MRLENGAKDSKTVQRSALCRSRRELSNEYLLAKLGVDTAENEPLEVWGKIIQYYSFVSLPPTLRAAGSFPTASPRERLETGNRFFEGLRREHCAVRGRLHPQVRGEVAEG